MEKQSNSIRLQSADVYRGFVMLLMMAEVLQFSKVSEALPVSGFWKFMTFHQSHVDWVGCSLHDLIQPSFTFLVGLVLPYSILSRKSKNESFQKMLLHTVWRAFILVILGVFLRSIHSEMTYYTFEDTLSQIGLGFIFLFVLGFTSFRMQFIAFISILVGYWSLFAFYPIQTQVTNYLDLNVAADWNQNLTGFAAHWNINANPAWAFDRWFLNLFPREKPFIGSSGGYSTLSFIPTLATMIFGLLIGNLMNSNRGSSEKLKLFVGIGIGAILMGLVLEYTGICPIVKKIWTPAWVLFSGGWCCLLLALFYFVIDVKKYARWAFVLKIIGMNSIAAYVFAHTLDSFISSSLYTHLGKNYNQIFGISYQTLVHGGLVLFIETLVLYWMYRKKIFVRV
jgi:predicted acyltransferase